MRPRMVCLAGERNHLSQCLVCPFIQYLGLESLIVPVVRGTSLPQFHSGHFFRICEVLACYPICWVEEILGFFRSVGFLVCL